MASTSRPASQGKSETVRMSEGRLVVRNVQQATVVELDDRLLVDAHTIERINGELHGLVAAQDLPRIAVDMSRVTYLSSAALSGLLTIRKKTEERGGAFVLCAVSANLVKLFKQTSLHKLIVFADTVEDGLKELDKGPAPS
jgi:anti-anti-sigma factor